MAFPLDDPDAAIERVQADVRAAQERAALGVAVAVAARLLEMSPIDARRHSRPVPEVDAYYFRQPVRGGGQLLVHRDGSLLFGASVLTFDQMVTASAEGRRTDPSAWE